MNLDFCEGLSGVLVNGFEVREREYLCFRAGSARLFSESRMKWWTWHSQPPINSARKMPSVERKSLLRSVLGRKK